MSFTQSFSKSLAGKQKFGSKVSVIVFELSDVDEIKRKGDQNVPDAGRVEPRGDLRCGDWVILYTLASRGVTRDRAMSQREAPRWRSVGKVDANEPQLGSRVGLTLRASECRDWSSKAICMRRYHQKGTGCWYNDRERVEI